MPSTDCLHPSAEDTARACVHLLAALRVDSPSFDLYKWFTGRGREFMVICTACRDIVDTAPNAAASLPLQTVCRVCLAQIEDEVCWDGIVGLPEVLERPSALRFLHHDVHVDGVDAGTLLDVQPVSGASRSVWVALSPTGHLLRLDLSTGLATTLVRVSESAIDLTKSVMLHVDHGGTFAAIAHRRGRQGIVLDLETGVQTMRLDRGTYRTENSAFSLAFLNRDGRPALVHATDWNRLDVSDPATGALLTERMRPLPSAEEPRTERFPNYFHAFLLVSPDQEWIADHGWVWAPAGIVRTWSLKRWLEDNVWESDDGQSLRRLCQRWYFWDGPMCWVSNRTLATWGYGTDDNNLINAAWLFDVESGEERGWFAGPCGPFIFDTYLFSLGGGTSVWDVATGERLHFDRSLCPTAYHRGTREFLSVLPNGDFRLSRLVGSEVHAVG